MNDETNSVGIIANPQSGKDIRRISAFGFLSNNYEKVNIIQRVLLGLDSTGVRRVFYMPEPFGIVQKAAEALNLSLKVIPLKMELEYGPADSSNAARLMEDRGVRCIVTLGGDGTNRAVVKGLARTPLLPISAGTNNVFPLYIDGTIAGVAAGMFARMDAEAPSTVCRKKRISVSKDGREVDLALIDAAICLDSFVGSKAIVDISRVEALVIGEVRTEVIGLAAIASFLCSAELGAEEGLHVVLSHNGRPTLTVKAPIAPGLIVAIPVAGWRKIGVGETVDVAPGDSVIALDGEREIEVARDGGYSISLSAEGPCVVDVAGTLRQAMVLGLFG
jgi:hypothetical protein